MNSDTYVGTINGVFGSMNADRWVFVAIGLGILAVLLLMAIIPGRNRRRTR